MPDRTWLLAALTVLCLLPAAPVSAAVLDQGESEVAATAMPIYSPDQVIVQWRAGADHGDKVAARDSAEVDYSNDLGNREFQLVKVEPGQAPAEAVAALEADPAVVLAERDAYRAPTAVPNDPLFSELWGLRNLGTGIHGFVGAVAGDDIDVVPAWNRTVGTPNVVIADIDTGYRFEYPDLGAVAWTNTEETAGNGIDDDANGYVDDVHGYDFVGANGEAPLPDSNPVDDDLVTGGHGVHTAGIIGAAGNNGAGGTGVARNVRIMPLRVCTRYPALNATRCSLSAIVNAINYAGKMGARVANMSLGGTTKSQAEANALAANPQTLFVVAAGNDGQNNESTHHYPCDFNPATDASPPVAGAIDNVVCVAATNQADGLASFSNYGESLVDLGAPGTETLSTYPMRKVISDNFEQSDFSSKWTAVGADGGFLRSNESPLLTFGMTDSPGAAPVAGSVKESLSAAGSLPGGLGPCELFQSRVVTPGTGGLYAYEVLQDGSVVKFFLTGASSAGRFRLEMGDSLAAGGSIQVEFAYAAGSAPTSDDGVWLDGIEMICAEPVGKASNYEFLQGTSMAAPHVSGAAALLFSLKPSATVTEVREALLDSVDPVASLAGKTVTGGRLDVAAALDDLVPPGTETVAPETAILSGPSGTVESGIFSFTFARTDADSATYECSLDGAAFSACTSPDEHSVAPGAHQFKVRAKSPGGLVDPTPATRDWTFVPPPFHPVVDPNPTTEPPVPCTVPKLSGKSLAQAKSALKTAGCALGKVTKPKPKKGKKLGALVVKSSTPGAGASTTGSVALKLGPKPKKRSH